MQEGKKPTVTIYCCNNPGYRSFDFTGFYDGESRCISLIFCQWCWARLKGEVLQDMFNEAAKASFSVTALRPFGRGTD